MGGWVYAGTAINEITNSKSSFFNKAAWTDPGPLAFGNAPARDGSVRGFMNIVEDVSIFKVTSFHERYRLRFEAQGGNVTNRVVFCDPGITGSTNWNSGSFGAISLQCNQPRSVQFGMKFETTNSIQRPIEPTELGDLASALTVVKEGNAQLAAFGAFLRAQRSAAVDVEVEVGAEAKLPVRLLAERVPEAVARKRQQRLRRRASKKGRPVSVEGLELCRWEVLITNVPQKLLSLREAQVLRRLRWQLELVFKV